jgi:hypothetical protein
MSKVKRCNHDFEGGLCKKCLCPETAADQRRAENALYNAERIVGTDIGNNIYISNMEEAILFSWRLNRRKGNL